MHDLEDELARRRIARERVRAADPDLFAVTAAVLFARDPVRIVHSPGDQAGEYDPEAGSILARRAEARSREELRRIVREEFARWFGARIAGPEAAYDGVARELWAAWEQGG